MNGFNSMMLIAVPQLVDPNFKRAVILMLHHDDAGSFGFVINHPTSLSLSEFAHRQNLFCHLDHRFHPVYAGGPVEPYRGWILHQNELLAEKQQVGAGLYVSASNESLQTILQESTDPMRFLLGYAGWGSKQLEKELADGSWITAPVDSKYVFFEKPEDTWDAMLHDMGVDPTRLALGHGIH